MGRGALEDRVQRAAVDALAAQGSGSAVDVLVRLGRLAPTHVVHWRQGRVDCLERMVQANPSKVVTAMTCFRRWADGQDLVASETTYVARTPDRRPLRFSVSGSETIERAYRTHWVSSQLSPARRERLAERSSRPPAPPELRGGAGR